ncbi:MAG: universal stress protein [Halobacteriota archaeon]
MLHGDDLAALLGGDLATLHGDCLATLHGGERPPIDTIYPPPNAFAAMAFERILLATDGSEGAQCAVDTAVSLAQDTGGTLHAVYVIETRTEYDNDIVDPDVIRSDLRRVGERALGDAETAADAASVPVRTSIRSGVPHEELLAYGSEHDIDAIVVSSRGSTGLKRALLGSTADALIRHSTIPVVVSPLDEQVRTE